MNFEVLSKTDIEAIHAATLRVLERTGVKLHHDGATKLLADAGCKVYENNIVKIPRPLVEKCMDSAPGEFMLYDRNGENPLTIGGRNSYFGTGVTNPNFLDVDTNERKPTCVQDIVNAAKVADYLPNIDWLMPLGSVQDTPAQVSDIYEFEAAVSNSTKPIVFICHDVKGVSDVFEMAETIAGGEQQLRDKPFVLSYPEPVSPLVHMREAVEKLLFSAEKGSPIIYTPAPMSGATAPVTMAGLLVQANAECISGLVIAQLTQPGVPFVVGGVLTIMDMSTGLITYGAPEMSLLLAGFADIAHYYNLPTWGTAGCSDSKLPDEQAAIEATFSSFVNALSGLNLIHDPGFLEGAMLGSLEMLVMTNEIAGMAKRFLKGITVNEETLAEDVIHTVGPGGHFLGEEHTVKYFRHEHWRPLMLDRRCYHAWKEDGGETMGQRVKDKIREILKDHQPQPLPKEILKKLREIRERSEKERVPAAN